MTVTLAPARGYVLDSITFQDEVFQGSRRFPTFQLFNEKGEERKIAGDSDFFSVTTKEVNGVLKVSYESPDFSAEVAYEFENGILVITTTPTKEGAWKVRGLTDRTFLSVGDDDAGSRNSAFLLRPFMGGQLLRMGEGAEKKEHTVAQSWEYCASFFALGLKNKGLIVRAPQYGATWQAGTESISGRYSLYGGLTADFRPRRDNPGPYKFWNIPLCEPFIQIEVVPFKDTNNDGTFNWVDAGVFYRKKFIRKNTNLDPNLKGAIIGKIDISLPIEDPEKYDSLIKQIISLRFAPQTWWLVGAHTPAGKRFEIPPHGAPDSSHDGANGYDYSRFKKDAAQVGARIGLHEMFQDTSELNREEWGIVPIRLQEYGEPMGTWAFATDRQEKDWAISKATKPEVENGRFFKQLRAHFSRWNVSKGDTWHWDVFTSEGGRADFDPAHATTHGKDFRERIEILREIQTRDGVHMTSEGLQEGVSEFCDFAWIFKGVNEQKTFANEESVPLTPVLFQGQTYYASAYLAPAYGLLMGGYAPYEGGTLDRQAIIQAYFGQNVFWSRICDLTVNNLIKTKSGWRVEYTEGGYLEVNLAGMTRSMTFTLQLGDETLTAETPPASPYGYSAQLINGAYHLEETLTGPVSAEKGNE